MAAVPYQSAMMRAIDFDNNSSIKIPRIIYGTTKEHGQTPFLVYQALKAGFKAIDASDIAAVGEAILKTLQEGFVKREELWIQSRFSNADGQDLELPLDERLLRSIKKSLGKMILPDCEPYLDCFLVPFTNVDETMQVWKACSLFVPLFIRTLGLYNVTPEILHQLTNSVDINVKPFIVQNVFSAREEQEGKRWWESELRKWCCDNNIVFQTNGIWTLKADSAVVQCALMKEMSDELRQKGIKAPTAVATYALVMNLENTCVLSGTGNAAHMKMDIEGLEILGRLIEGEWMEKWDYWFQTFTRMITDAPKSFEIFLEIITEEQRKKQE